MNTGYMSGYDIESYVNKALECDEYDDELTKLYNEDGDEVDMVDPCWDCSGCTRCLL